MERGSSVSSTEDVDLKTDESQRISKQSQPATSCTRWCVVEGVAKHDNEISWKRIKLKGGRPVVPNRFGKYIPFVLEPSNIDVPCDFRDNFICGLCVRDNERLNGERFGSTVPLATRKQRLASQRSDSHNASDDEDNETLLSTFTRGDGIRASVKRKRVEDHSRRTESQDGLELECQALLTKRQRNSLSTSNPRIPASPVVRKARGEKLKLPRNHKKAWRPKKTSRSMSPLKVVEDASFAQKVEAIIKTTLPGSEEELNMIMSKNCRVQRSPTKN
ncbi:uncharacterized protein LOC116301191 [Actinia tenebrosa]|uniref:Uncharacterized protein LOC116301191 n=1 Tax=Actinia tenebrosa TaxID=6105 RepID=A0A6P8IHC9_ACTTE|nr:uncharacterized protein LOC116301191 [Actinia tenebrosa]